MRCPRKKLPRALEVVGEEKGMVMDVELLLKGFSCCLFFFPQDIDTAIVSDTTDDLWFLNECPLEQGSAGLKVEVLDCEEVTGSATKVPQLGLV